MNCSRCRQPVAKLYDGACDICADNMYEESVADEAQQWLAEHSDVVATSSEDLPF